MHRRLAVTAAGDVRHHGVPLRLAEGRGVIPTVAQERTPTEHAIQILTALSQVSTVLTRVRGRWPEALHGRDGVPIELDQAGTGRQLAVGRPAKAVAQSTRQGIEFGRGAMEDFPYR
jgi:hypothetical protein